MIIADNKDLHIEKLVLGPYETNAYILICKKTNESAVVDAPAQADKIEGRLHGTTPRYIFLTHDHYDHTDGLAALREKLNVPLAAHDLSSSQLIKPPEILFYGGETVKLGNLVIQVLFTPGHTAGSICFKTGRYLFAGDTLFPGGPGHTDTPDDFKTIIKSITGKIYRLSPYIEVLTGHGDSIPVGKSKEEYAKFAVKPHFGNYGDVTWAD